MEWRPMHAVWHSRLRAAAAHDPFRARDVHERSRSPRQLDHFGGRGRLRGRGAHRAMLPFRPHEDSPPSPRGSRAAARLSSPTGRAAFTMPASLTRSASRRYCAGIRTGVFAVNFRCKPFWYQANVPVETLTASTSTINNPGSVYSEPVITVYGTGDITLMVGTVIVELEGVSGSITLDSELQKPTPARRA